MKDEIRKIYIFDFDGTLFRSPEDTPENKKLYEKHTGIPWHITKEHARELTRRLKRPVNPRSGWWGKKESLLPPLVPDPIPKEMWIESTLEAFANAQNDKNGKVLIMTGRHTGLEREVLRILSHNPLLEIKKVEKPSTTNWAGIKWEEGETYRDDTHRYLYIWSDPFVELKLLGMDGPCPDVVGTKPTSTREWKVWVLHQYRLLYHNVEEIEFWEDRAEHVEHFRSLNDEFKEKVIVNHVRG